jgi:protein associated with RNAse G/E
VTADAPVPGVTGTAIDVAYTKYDGSLHWHHSARLLGEDEHGVWTGCPPGTPGGRGSEVSVVWEHAFVTLFPRHAWFTVNFNAEPQPMAIYCDITTVPQWRDGRMTMVDLDLDVLRLRDGRVLLDDADEFAEHQVRYAYPPEVIAEAERSAAWLMVAVRQGLPPFDGAHARWLAEVT